MTQTTNQMVLPELPDGMEYHMITFGPKFDWRKQTRPEDSWSQIVRLQSAGGTYRHDIRSAIEEEICRIKQ